MYVYVGAPREKTGRRKGDVMMAVSGTANLKG
jgi:hypothetical protein